MKVRRNKNSRLKYYKDFFDKTQQIAGLKNTVALIAKNSSANIITSGQKNLEHSLQISLRAASLPGHPVGMPAYHA